MTYDVLYAVSATHPGGRGRKAGNRDREERKHSENASAPAKLNLKVPSLSNRFLDSIEDDKLYEVNLS